jgi:hypothetical protein
MSGLSEFNENSAVHPRDASSNQRTVSVSAEAETMTGPRWTPEMSTGIVAATLRKGMKKMKDRMDLTRERHLTPATAIKSPNEDQSQQIAESEKTSRL